MTTLVHTWREWEVITITSGSNEMIVGISAGPRIFSLRLNGGENLLYIDNTGFKVGDWFLYGGHRLTTAPENEESYYPDNEPCELIIEDFEVVIKAAVRPNKSRLSIKIIESSAVHGFDIIHELENVGDQDWSGALWAITCLPRHALVTANCNSSVINYWPGTDSSNWQVVDKKMQVKAGSYRGKAGWHEKNAWFAATQFPGDLMICNPEISEPDDCVDGGCNTEIFVCHDYFELETLSKRIIVPPGKSARHVQHWRLFDNVS